MMNIKAHGSEKNYGIDRISSLPDEILMHILSFLSTRKAAQTCILSKRWINTWASVPDLKFDIKELGLPEIIDDEMAVEFVTKFELLVKSVLEKREISYVNRFRLWLESWVYWPRTQGVADCIGDVMKLKPRKCLVKMGLCENLNLNTDLIFTCTSLVYLQLCLSTEFDTFVAIEPNSVNLPCLKTLNLDGFTMSNDSLRKLLLGCPLLQELVLENCYLGGIIKICSDTLKKLVLRKCYEVTRLHISTPNLMYLDIIVDTRDILLLNMSLLVDASIYLYGWYDQDTYVTMGPKLIYNLSNVESLQLKFDFPNGKVQKKDFSSYPVFNNLKRLKLVSWRFSAFDLPPYFLHHSPKLQELTLTNRSAFVTEFVDEEITQERTGDALVQREFLKTVRIVGFKNDKGFVDQLINKLLVHVKIIGEIDIVRRDPLS